MRSSAHRKLPPCENKHPLVEATPFALVHKQANCLQIFALNEAARQGGVQTGMRLTDACSLLPTLMTQPADIEADACTLRKLADWCQRYSPVVSLDAQDGLYLDITGAAHLCGGEEPLLTDLSKRLCAFGFANQLGLADTPGAASAMARFARSQTCAERIIPPGNSATFLALLPIASLRLEKNALYLLNRFGLKTVSDLCQIPRTNLKRRFSSKEIGEAVLHRLDQALGRASEPLVPLKSAPAYREHISYAEPILATESFHHGLQYLLERLCQRMEKDSKGTTSLTYAAYHADGGVSQTEITTASPSRNVPHLQHLFHDRIETINPGFGVDHLILSANTVEPLAAEQLALTASVSGRSDCGVVHQLVDRLSNRLGAHNVQRSRACESHIPERAEQRVLAIKSTDSGQHTSPPKPLRPLRLLNRPEPIEVMAECPEGPPMRFTWRRVAHQIVRAEGPERIAPEWWSEPSGRKPRTRDYYRVEDVKGRRFWLFRNGLYRDHAPQLPTWHIHGLFT